MKSLKLIPSTYIALVFAFIYIPILCVVLYSFNESKMSAVWSGFTFEWYKEMLNDWRLWDAFKISLQVGAASSLIAAVIGTIAAVSFIGIKKRWRSIFSGLIYAPIIIPEIILGVAFMMFFYVVNVNYGMITLILSHSTFCVPYVFLLVNIRLQAIDKAVLEAARDLGANRMQVFFSITLPLVFPGILTGTLLAFAMSLDDVVISFFVTGPTSTTLPMQIYSMLKLGVTPKINALCTVILLVSFVIACVMQITVIRPVPEP